MIVTTTTDSAAWAKALDFLVEKMREAGAEASLAGAQDIQDVTRARLTEVKHSEVTWGSPPGESPFSVSGDLAASIQAEMVGPDQAWVGPTAGYGRSGDYARIQELGGDMKGHPLMIFYKVFDGSVTRFEREFVELFPRPYLEPATSEVVDSGRLISLYVAHWTAAIEEVAG